MATLLTPGRQQFVDANGAPLVGGAVSFFVPGTTVPKNTWQDPAATILNTNPVILDQLGSAAIFGVGSYRVVVRDARGNLLWDSVTTDPSAQQVNMGLLDPMVATLYGAF